MYKNELARAAGVSSDTFRRWLSASRNELEALGVSPNAKLLNPAAVRYLCEKFVIEFDE
ncbi:MAG: hypothetical protein ACI3Z7_05240 [Candidatus Aphodosoma sp.]